MCYKDLKTLFSAVKSAFTTVFIRFYGFITLDSVQINVSYEYTFLFMKRFAIKQ